MERGGWFGEGMSRWGGEVERSQVEREGACADPGIFVRGGPGKSDIKKL